MMLQKKIVCITKVWNSVILCDLNFCFPLLAEWKIKRVGILISHYKLAVVLGYTSPLICNQTLPVNDVIHAANATFCITHDEWNNMAANHTLKDCALCKKYKVSNWPEKE